MSNELTELEKLAVKVSEGDSYDLAQVSKILDQLIEEGQKITERINPKPMFPVMNCINVHIDGNTGTTDMLLHPENHAKRGRTAYTKEEAKRLDKRDLARVRVLEKIYAANGGKVRGFIRGEWNYFAHYSCVKNEMVFDRWNFWQNLPNEFYFSEEAAEILEKDEDFKRDVAVWLGRE